MPVNPQLLCIIEINAEVILSIWNARKNLYRMGHEGNRYRDSRRGEIWNKSAKWPGCGVLEQLSSNQLCLFLRPIIISDFA